MNYKNHAYYTHQPFLIETLKHTYGNVLECGCGDGSTLAIKSQLQSTGRQLVTLESDLNWLGKYTHLSDKFHRLYHVGVGCEDTPKTGDQWVEFLERNELNDFDVVFLDSTPWSSRKACFEYFLNKAKVILIHDFDYFPLHNLIGYVTNVEIDNSNGVQKVKRSVNLDGIVKHYKLFHPPYEYFAGESGPPTLICSNTMSDTEFQDLITTIETNIPSYYS